MSYFADKLDFLPTCAPSMVMIHGLKYAGKSTLADALTEFGYVREKFAGPLKDMVRALYRARGISAEQIEHYVEGDQKQSVVPELTPNDLRFSLSVDEAVLMVKSMLRHALMPDEQIEYYSAYQGQHDKLGVLNGIASFSDLREALLGAWVPMLSSPQLTTRRLFETLGEDYRDLFGKTMWAEITRERASRHIQAGKRVVIDDNRHEFEFEKMSRFKPFKFVITRGDQHFQPITHDTSAGERPMPVEWFDCWIDNRSTKEAVWMAAQMALATYADFHQRLIRRGLHTC